MKAPGKKRQKNSTAAAPKTLKKYNQKRSFDKTSEPAGLPKKASGGKKTDRLLYVIQEHHASHLHYDFRLEWEGVLKSWAVPKGPSTDPKDRRLAVQVEDHPYDYHTFEGTIPAGEYGGGTVKIWDKGVWIPEGDVAANLKKGHLSFQLWGRKLRGRWALVRLHGQKGDGKNWLLFSLASQKPGNPPYSNPILPG